jgi:hypothetical protein
LYRVAEVLAQLRAAEVPEAADGPEGDFQALHFVAANILAEGPQALLGHTLSRAGRHNIAVGAVAADSRIPGQSCRDSQVARSRWRRLEVAARRKLDSPAPTLRSRAAKLATPEQCCRQIYWSWQILSSPDDKTQEKPHAGGCQEGSYGVLGCEIPHMVNGLSIGLLCFVRSVSLVARGHGCWRGSRNRPVFAVGCDCRACSPKVRVFAHGILSCGLL